MTYFEQIIADSSVNAAFDTHLWSKLYDAYPRLADAPDSKLNSRLAEIEKNIQFLVGSASWNTTLAAECGWQSPWWWFRAYEFTLIEFQRRRMTPVASIDIGEKIKLHRDYLKRRKPSLVRISKLEWLLDLLDGKIRFGAASDYTNQTLQESQRDDEISRKFFFPGSLATIKSENGLSTPLTGEIQLSGSRTHSGQGMSTVRPYWLLCFSTELDPRLLCEFERENPRQLGFFVLFNVEKFHRRLAEAVQPLGLVSGRVEVDYYDEHFPPSWKDGQFHVIGLKPFRFAYQRELRFFLLPDGDPRQFVNSHVFLKTEKMDDIAGVYNSMGQKEAGYGPKTLFPAR